MCGQAEAKSLGSDSNGGVDGAVGDRLTVRGRDLDELGGCALRPSGEGRMVACDTGRVCLPHTGAQAPVQSCRQAMSSTLLTTLLRS